MYVRRGFFFFFWGGVGGFSKILLMVDNSNCDIGPLPITYCRLPLGTNPHSKAIYDLRFTNFEKKLSTWMGQYLTFGG